MKLRRTTREASTRSDEDSVYCEPTARPVLGDAWARDYACLFKALADPTRVQIITMLAEADQQGGLCVCDIVANFRLEQPTISHHLRVLREAGLVTARKQGPWVYYSLNRARLAQVSALARAP